MPIPQPRYRGLEVGELHHLDGRYANAPALQNLRDRQFCKPIRPMGEADHMPKTARLGRTDLLFQISLVERRRYADQGSARLQGL